MGNDPFVRRRLLEVALVLAVVALAMQVLVQPSEPPRPAPWTGPGNPLGPNYTFGLEAGADLTEGAPGPLMDMVVRVTDGRGNPVKGAHVEVWHADPSGQYSRAPSRRCRGRLATDGEGLAVFRTLEPGVGAEGHAHVHARVTHPDFEELVASADMPEEGHVDSRRSSMHVEMDTSGAVPRLMLGAILRHR